MGLNKKKYGMTKDDRRKIGRRTKLVQEIKERMEVLRAECEERVLENEWKFPMVRVGGGEGVGGR
jgi:hypothetical protein